MNKTKFKGVLNEQETLKHIFILSFSSFLFPDNTSFQYNSHPDPQDTLEKKILYTLGSS